MQHGAIMDEEEERKTKLQAGKDALLAFQKKKKKKKLKSDIPADNWSLNKTAPPSINNITAPPTNHDSETTPAFNNSFSYIQTNSGHTPNNNLPNVNNTDDFVDHAHSNNEFLKLNQLVSELKESNSSLQLELSTLRKEHDVAIMNVQSASHYKNEVGVLQRKLISNEEALQNKQKEIDELKLTHNSELIKLRQEQEMTISKEIEAEREKHLQHVTRLTKQLEEATPAPLLVIDNDEREAERVKQLKIKLQEMHEKEKESILLSHQKEKDILREEFEKQKEQLTANFQQAMDNNKKQLESLANEQIKQIHSQYVAAHSQVIEEKQKIENTLLDLRTHCNQLTNQIVSLEKDKDEISQQLEKLKETHHRQLEDAQNNSLNLEKRLHDWKNKADDLEKRLEHTTSQIVLEKEDALQQLQEDYESKLADQMDVITNLQGKLREKERSLDRASSEHKQEMEKLCGTLEELEKKCHSIDESHKREIENLNEQHQIELNKLNSEHSSQVSLLEESITETASSQASLELAKLHMDELRQQLNAYRNQERSTIETFQEHTSSVERLTKENEMKLEEPCNETMKSASGKISDLENSLKQAREEKEGLKKNFEEDLLIQLKLQETQFKDEYEKKMADLQQSHKEEMIKMSSTLTAKHNKEIEEERNKILLEKECEIAIIKEECKRSVQDLKESLSTSSVDQEALASAKLRVVELEQKVQEYEMNYSDTRQLQEQLHKCQTKLNSSQVSCSLVESELRQEREVHDKTRQEIEKLKQELFEAISQADTMKEENNVMKKSYEASLQTKEDEIATFLSQNQSLQSHVKVLSQELKEERSKKPLEEDKQKLLEVRTQLEQAKNKYSALVNEWSDKEKSLQEKLQNREKLLNDRELQWNNESEQYSKEIKKLQDELSQTSTTLNETTTKLESANQELVSSKQKFELDKDMLNMKIKDISDSCEELTREKASIESRLNESLDLNESLQEAVNELQKQLKERMCSNEKSSLEDKQVIKELEKKLQSQEHANKELQNKFEAKLAEAELKQLSLQKQIQVSNRVEGRMSSLLNERGGIEKSLARSRQSLIEKLREKQLLEKDLSYHRTQLERRLQEKERLEELMFEKSRYEKELKSQREQLYTDLEKIERKLQLKEIEQEPSDQSHLSNQSHDTNEISS